MAASEANPMKENNEPYRRTNGGSEHYGTCRSLRSLISGAFLLPAVVIYFHIFECSQAESNLG